MWISCPIGRTTTYRSMSCCLTTSTISAWLSELARVKTLIFNACPIFRAVNIMLTFSLFNWNELFSKCFTICLLFRRLKKWAEFSINKYTVRERLKILLFVHCLYGSPSNPGGQVQLALWLLTEQIAVWLQGFSVVHGFIHLRFWQAWLGEHSKSDEQPIGSGSADKW